MEFSIVDYLIFFLQGWKSNKSIFGVTITWLFLCIYFLLTIDYTKNQVWYSISRVHYIILSFLILITIYLYIAYNRCHIPKAKKKTTGILFCISFSNVKQEKVIYENFIKPFRNMINKSSQGTYDIIILNDYICNKYLDKLESAKNSKEIEMMLLKKSNCEVLFWGSCLECGECEPSFCKIRLNNGTSCKIASNNINFFLENNIHTLFESLKEIYISEKDRTDDFQNTAEILGYIFQYILATTHFMNNKVKLSLEIFKDLKISISNCSNNSQIISDIKNTCQITLGLCYAVLSNKMYSQFVTDRNISHLKVAVEYMSHPEIKEIEYDTNILMAICVFKINRNPNESMMYLEKCNQNLPLVKINKSFIHLYTKTTAKNIKNAYLSYKLLDKLPEERLYEIEAFIYEEYNNDNNKSQLLFLLTMLYMYQENFPLAKSCFDLFCEKHSDLLDAKSLHTIFNKIVFSLKDVTLPADSLKLT